MWRDEKYKGILSKIKNLKSSETQTEEIPPPLKYVASQASQTEESHHSFIDYEDCSIRTASSSSISALYSNSRGMPNCDKTHPNTIVRGIRGYGESQHILGYSHKNRTKNMIRENNTLKNYKTANSFQLKRNMSCDNIYHGSIYKSCGGNRHQTIDTLSTLVWLRECMF